MLTFRRVVQFITFCALIVAVLASPAGRRTLNASNGTNAQRISQGLSPVKPRALYKPDTTREPRNYPSGTPGGSCGTNAYYQCCVAYVKANDSLVVSILKSLGLYLSADVDVGVTCSSSSICLTQKLCCSDINHFGLVSTGCSKL